MISYQKLKKSPLFRGIQEKDTMAVLSCLAPSQKKYKKGETIFRVGEAVPNLGFILRGSVSMEKEDFWGNRSILEHLGEGDIFGESFASLGAESAFNAVAAEDSDILFLSIGPILTCCSSVCSFHQQLIRNLLALIAEKKYNHSPEGRSDVETNRQRKAACLPLRSGTAVRFLFLSDSSEAPAACRLSRCRPESHDGGIKKTGKRRNPLFPEKFFPASLTRRSVGRTLQASRPHAFCDVFLFFRLLHRLRKQTVQKVRYSYADRAHRFLICPARRS